MFGSIMNRFQTFSPVTSPKMSRRKFKSPAHRRSLKDEYRDVQSEPEDVCSTATPLAQPSRPLPSASDYRRRSGPLLPPQQHYRQTMRPDAGGPPPPSSATSSAVKKNRGRKQQQMLLLSKSKSTARLDISGPTEASPVMQSNYRHGSKSMGRLDGLKQVHIL
jgi:hypothetical protein